MGKQNSKFRIILVAVYAILVIIALTYLIIMLSYYPEKSEFAGIYIGMLTFPWSFAIVSALDTARMIDKIPLSINISIFIGCAILNAFILYWFGKKIEKNW